MTDAGASEVPVGRTVFETSTSEETWNVVEQLYTRISPSPGPATMTAQSWDTPGLALDTLRIPAAAVAEAEGPEQLMLVWSLDGNVGVDYRHGDQVRCGPGDSFLLVPRTPYRFRFDSVDAVMVRMPLHVLDRAAQELTGIEPGGLRFTSARPVSREAARYWAGTAARIRQSVTAPGEVIGSPLIHRELINLVAAAAVSVFPNTAMTRGYVPGPGDARLSVVRRATAYVDAHASLPITSSDIAEAAGTSARELHAAFRRHLDTTPAAYLQRVRIEGAHRDLRAADPTRGTTVAEIAARWGFADAGRFTAEYRQVYGCSPTDTLRA